MVVQDGQYWIIVEKNNLYIKENPLTANTFHAIGQSSNKYDFYMYLRAISQGEEVEYNKEFD